jgi:hypothetical protein
MQEKAMLSWLDILKLCVPFIFSIILLWFKEWLTSYRERKRKEAYLWKTIIHESGELAIALKELDLIAKGAKDRPRVVAFYASVNNILSADRLAELDFRNAHVYSEYSAHTEIVAKGFAFLKDLTKEAITAKVPINPNLTLAIVAQTKSLRDDLVALAEREVDVLNVIRSANRKYNAQDICKHSEMIDQIKQAIKNGPSICS